MYIVMRNLCIDVESSIVGICILCFYERIINKSKLLKLIKFILNVL